MKPQESTFIITREDRAVDPLTIVTEGLTIGRLPDCELVLNHPTVSRIHAGIKELGGRFYIFNLSPSNSTTLNGKLVEERQALADGDIVQIGPFFLYINREDNALSIRVTLQVAVRVGDTEVQQSESQPVPQTQPSVPATPAVGAEGSADALEVFWDKRKREKGKMARPTPLHPHAPSPRVGKARWNWTPTRDLVRPWPFALFTWGVIFVGIFSIVAAVVYPHAFSPAPISNPHTRSQFSSATAIAKQPNGDSCTTCHTVRTSMEKNCTSCHQTEAFVATVTQPHVAAGISCLDCHTEHRGRDFSPRVASLNQCVECHNDNNKKLYNGRKVGTPHGGTFGYPVVNGQWTWKGLDEEEWAQKPPEIRKVAERLPTDTDNEWRSKQFHALHLYRVRAGSAFAANESGEMSCSSCHQSFSPIDRETPRMTCGKCHNGRTEGQLTLIAADAPNCTSCHVQHVKDKRHWNPSLLANSRQAALNPATGQNAISAP